MRLLTLDGTNIELLEIPPGVFRFSTLNNRIKSFCVFTKPFWISKLPTSLSLWKGVMDAEADIFDARYRFVRGIDWQSMREFCDRLHKINRELMPVGCNVSLPSQFQWERAFNFNIPYSQAAVFEHKCNHERADNLVIFSNSDSGLSFVENFWEYCLDSPLDRNPIVGINPIGSFEPIVRSTRGIRCNSDGSIEIDRSYSAAGPAAQKIRSPWNGFRLAVHSQQSADDL